MSQPQFCNFYVLKFSKHYSNVLNFNVTYLVKFKTQLDNCVIKTSFQVHGIGEKGDDCK